MTLAHETDATDALTRRLLAVAVVAAASATAVQSVVHLVGLAFFDLEIEVLNADADTSVCAWASIVATLAAAFAALLLAVASWPLHAGRYAALAAVLAFFSLDDMVQIHGRVSQVWKHLGVPEDWHLAAPGRMSSRWSPRKAPSWWAGSLSPPA